MEVEKAVNSRGWGVRSEVGVGSVPLLRNDRRRSWRQDWGSFKTITGPDCHKPQLQVAAQCDSDDTHFKINPLTNPQQCLEFLQRNCYNLPEHTECYTPLIKFD